MVGHVLIVQRPREHPLAQQILGAMEDLPRLAGIRKPPGHRLAAQAPFLELQKHHPAIGGNISASEVRHHPPPSTGWQFNLLHGTNCHRWFP